MIQVLDVFMNWTMLALSYSLRSTAYALVEPYMLEDLALDELLWATLGDDCRGLVNNYQHYVQIPTSDDRNPAYLHTLKL